LAHKKQNYYYYYYKKKGMEEVTYATIFKVQCHNNIGLWHGMTGFSAKEGG
jgi:hypothetical protein